MVGGIKPAERAQAIRLVITDCDGVLTDTGVYYSARGEEMKRFSIRDGMGVERLRNSGIDVGIMSGEKSPSLIKRAEKLRIDELHLGVRDKLPRLVEVSRRLKLPLSQMAFIGDDVNDIEAMNGVGLCGCPGDALPSVRKIAHFVTKVSGGHGAFREFADWIIQSRDSGTSTAIPESEKRDEQIHDVFETTEGPSD